MYTIGVMDSGLGGISMLRLLQQELVGVHLVYYGDLQNSPYGNHSKEQIIEYSKRICQIFMTKKVNSILVACNTATSAAIDSIRRQYTLPIFGMEPAIKPALAQDPQQKVAVLATPFTAVEEKYTQLQHKLAACDMIYTIACKGLSEWIDRWQLAKIKSFLQDITATLRQQNIRKVVLGCTHYLFIREIFWQVYPQAIFFDGHLGTLRHMLTTLALPIHANQKNQIEILLPGADETIYRRAKKWLNQT